ncbi:MAG: lytic transglycosylase [Gammaproteobacteria bacterium]|nr:lytic transglycosylase [Gammaproteobacteria bacterium]HCL71269.1 lytic murein transglycosylase [Gammaproteobacteria bacterium]
MRLILRVLPLVLSLFVPALLAQENEQSFADWLAELRAEARELGISEATLRELDNLQPLERVMELDSSQPEFVQTFTRYLGLRVTPNQVARGQSLLQQHSVLLEQVRQRYGVQPHYLVAFWAVESNYGRSTGGFSVLEALATLAFDPRRADFFRRQLLTALQIIDDGHIQAERMSGSWAGAMGQLQFMPNIFYQYGIDGDRDGRIDIWNSLPDIFHSAANFLSQSGWRGDERWGREVLLTEDFDFSLTGTSTRKPLQEWRDLGVTQLNGAPIPVAAGMEASVILPAGAQGPAFLGYANFRTTMTYNPSTFYALTVGHLADRYAGSGPVQRMPENETAMSVADVRELQELLNRNGFDSGEPDGRVGRQTRAAIRAYQQSAGLPMDGHASVALLQALRK